MRLALVLWCVLWGLIGLPWRSFRSSPSFQRVQLIPFVDGSMRSHSLNILAFVPLGIIGIRLGWSPRTVMLVAAGLSLLTELLQLFSARRFPSMTDLLLNTAGAVIGMVMARGFQKPGTEPPSKS